MNNIQTGFHNKISKIQDNINKSFENHSEEIKKEIYMDDELLKENLIKGLASFQTALEEKFDEIDNFPTEIQQKQIAFWEDFYKLGNDENSEKMRKAIKLKIIENDAYQATFSDLPDLPLWMLNK
ncbi:hypothetical protein [Lonepinella sp. BR2357]|uniref:hypothetical protein n=1 Tax=Lonepinella sp. BR2357 TaxID=3434549 RepID=UPI003F6DD66A